jgi:hypothetical protein
MHPAPLRHGLDWIWINQNPWTTSRPFSGDWRLDRNCTIPRACSVSMAQTSSAASLVTCSTGLAPRAPPISRVHRLDQWIHQPTNSKRLTRRSRASSTQDRENPALLLTIAKTLRSIDRKLAMALASPASPRLLPQLLQYGSSADGAGGEGGVIHDAPLQSPKLMGAAARAAAPPRPVQNRLAAPTRPGAPPREGAGGQGGAIN